jgi:hypothetical protein
LLLQGGFQSLDGLLEIIPLFFHILDSLVALCEQALQAADFGEEVVANVHREFFDHQTINCNGGLGAKLAET